MSSTEPRFELSEREIDDRTHVIAVRGEIHVSTAPEFSERLNAAIAGGKTNVVLDLGEVEFIDSTGISVMLNGLRRVTRRDGRLAIVCANPTVLRLFEITRLEETFYVYPTVDDALVSLRLGAQLAPDSDGGAP